MERETTSLRKRQHHNPDNASSETSSTVNFIEMLLDLERNVTPEANRRFENVSTSDEYLKSQSANPSTDDLNGISRSTLVGFTVLSVR